MIYVKSKAQKGHASKFNETFNYAMKEDNDGNMDHRKEKNQLLNFQ